MKILSDTSLCYDDVLILPNYSEIVPNDAITASRFSKNVSIKVPIASSAMGTVTNGSMAHEMAKLGGIGVIHKNYSIEDQVIEVLNAKNDESLVVAAATGVGEKEYLRAQALVRAGIDVLVIDTAHGHSSGVMNQVKKYKQSFKVDVVAGNVATEDGARALVEAGADGVKIGIGPGSICTTRVVAGIGVPQLQALVNCSEYLKSVDIPFIADGGIRHSGDIVKALATGASCVMLGSLLAGCEEAASETVIHDGAKFKRYRGMGSLTAMSMGSKDRYGQAEVGEKKKLVPEGVEGLIKSKGSLNEFLYQLVGGLRSGMGYVGANNLEELFEKAKFVKISSASLKENHPHNILIDVGAPNY